METKKTTIIAIILIGLAVSGILYFSFTPFGPFTLLSVSQAYIDPQGGYFEGDKFKGAYWLILVSVDQANEGIAGLKLKSDSQGNTYIETSSGTTAVQTTVGDKKLVVQSEILINLDPQQPYYVRSLQAIPYMVYPNTYGTGMGLYGASVWRTTDMVPRLDVTTWQWKDQWAKYTPFSVSLSKNGTVIKTIDNFDTEGSQQTITIEGVTISHLGYFEGKETIDTSKIIMLAPDKILTYSDETINDIKYDAWEYSFSNYWFGGGKIYTEPRHASPIKRWQDVSPPSPAHYYQYIQNYVVYDSDFPGTYRADSGVNRFALPLAADVFKNNPDASKADKYNPEGFSVWNYLTQKRGKNPVSLDFWNQGVNVSTTGDSKVRVKVPFNAVSYGAPVVQIRIPVELADTIVWRPAVANVKIVDFKWYTGGTNVDIGGEAQAILTVKQTSTVRSSADITLKLEPSNLPGTITPSLTGVALDPNEEKTIYIKLSNLGTSADVTGKLIAVITEKLTGSETARGELTFKFLKTSTMENVLTVKTIDKSRKIAVSGITVAIQYGTESDSAISQSGSASWSLGAYQGGVTITTAATAEYQAAETSYAMHSGLNEVTLELLKVGEEEEIPWWEQYWWLIVLAIALIIITIIAVAWLKSRE